MLTKAEACRELKLSLSTLNRRIASGEVAATKEPRGRRHRVYVMLDDDPPGNDDNADSGDTAPVAAQERIRGLEEQVECLQGQLKHEQQRNAELAQELQANQARHGPWWRFWRWVGDTPTLTGLTGREMIDSKTNSYDSYKAEIPCPHDAYPGPSLFPCPRRCTKRCSG